MKWLFPMAGFMPRVDVMSVNFQLEAWNPICVLLEWTIIATLFFHCDIYIRSTMRVVSNLFELVNGTVLNMAKFQPLKEFCFTPGEWSVFVLLLWEFCWMAIFIKTLRGAEQGKNGQYNIKYGEWGEQLNVFWFFSNCYLVTRANLMKIWYFVWQGQTINQNTKYFSPRIKQCENWSQ